MKLQFDANLHYQEQAVSAVVDLFRGQTPKQSNFTVSNYSDQGTMFTDNGVGNKLELVEDEILENLQAVQLRNGLPQTKTLKRVLMTLTSRWRPAPAKPMCTCVPSLS